MGLLAADVWTNAVCLFFQGDKINPLVWGELAGEVLPYQTTWRLSSNEPMRRRQEELGSYSPVLEVYLRKAPHSWGMWEKVFKQCVQAKLMVQQWQEGKPRDKGIPGVAVARRAGYDLDEPDFWSFVNEYCHETFKKTGHSTAPKKRCRWELDDVRLLKRASPRGYDADSPRLACFGPAR